MKMNISQIPEPYLTVIKILLMGLTFGLAANIARMINNL